MTEPTEQVAAAEETASPTKQTSFYSIPSLERLNEELDAIFDDPYGTGVAQSDAQQSVLGHVGNAYWHQDQIPIPTGSSGSRGAFVALMAAVNRLESPSFSVLGDLRPDESERVTIEQDRNGRMNPIRLFDEHMPVALYPTASVRARLDGIVTEERLRGSIGSGPLVLIVVDDYIDFDTFLSQLGG